MTIRGKLLRAALTVTVALAAGHLVQVRQPANDRADLAPVPLALPGAAAVAQSPDLPQDITPVSAGPAAID